MGRIELRKPDKPGRSRREDQWRQPFPWTAISSWEVEMYLSQSVLASLNKWPAEMAYVFTCQISERQGDNRCSSNFLVVFIAKIRYNATD